MRKKIRELLSKEERLVLDAYRRNSLEDLAKLLLDHFSNPSIRKQFKDPRQEKTIRAICDNIGYEKAGEVFDSMEDKKTIKPDETYTNEQENQGMVQFLRVILTRMMIQPALNR